MSQGAYLSTAMAIRICCPKSRTGCRRRRRCRRGCCRRTRVVVLATWPCRPRCRRHSSRAARFAPARQELAWETTTHLRVESVVLAELCLRRLHHRAHELRRGRGRRLAPLTTQQVRSKRRSSGTSGIPRSKTRGLMAPRAKTAKIWPGHILEAAKCAKPQKSKKLSRRRCLKVFSKS